MDIDKRILNAIKDRFKTCKEISKELEESIRRISVRMKNLRRRNSVYQLYGTTGESGVSPTKYKAKS